MPRVYFRKKHGRGFRYVDGQGKTVRDEKLKGWFKSLVIPPAWTEVEISGMKSANLLVTGRDDKGRKQYIYHPDFVRKQNQKKFERLVSFGEKLHHLREVVASHLRKRGNSREKVLAAMVRLMDETYMRPGNPKYTAENESYGLTTLRSKHIEITGNEITFTYKGKSGQEQEHHVQDRILAKIVRELDEMPGYRIFKYLDRHGKRHEINSDDLNTYIRDIMGDEFSAKDFRTWAGSLLAAVALDELGITEEDDPNLVKKNIQNIVGDVAEKLGNTPAVARDSYIDPRILTHYQNRRTLSQYCDAAASLLDDYTHLSHEEIYLLCMLKS